MFQNKWEFNGSTKQECFLFYLPRKSTPYILGGGEGEGKQGGREGGGQKANQQVIFALQGRRELHCGYLRG